MAERLRCFMAERGVDWNRFARSVDDVHRFAPAYIGPALPLGADVWGIQRASMSYGAGAYDEISRYPLAGAASVETVEAYPWPDPDAYDYEAVRAQLLADNPGLSKASMLTGGNNPFETYCWMTGLEEALVNLADHPEVVVAALRCITNYYEARLRRACEKCGDLIDLVFIADDLGGQQGLLLSRRMYRRLLQPFHRQLKDIVHALAPQARTVFHTDGAVFDIVPDLIDAGVDVLEAVQTDAAGMDPERLKDAFGRRLAFHGGIPVQSLLPFGAPSEVEAECRRLVAVFGAGGGYIAAPTHAIQAGTPPENVLAMLRAVLGER
jgi:uroporphyrinogen decarboxylase